MVLDGELRKNKRTWTLDNIHCTVEMHFFVSPMWSGLPSPISHTALPHIMHDHSQLLRYDIYSLTQQHRTGACKKI